MERPKSNWAVGVAAPWCLSAALVVSVPAGAGEEISSGVSVAPLPVRIQGSPAWSIPRPLAADRLEADVLELDGVTSGANRLLQQASLSVGARSEFKCLPDEIEPRADLKTNARGYPEIDRSRKGDPLAGLRPGFDASLPHAPWPIPAEATPIEVAPFPGYIQPGLAKRLEKSNVIGHHAFYKLKPGQG